MIGVCLCQDALGLTPLALAVALNLRASLDAILDLCSTTTVTAAAGGTANPDVFAPDVRTGNPHRVGLPSITAHWLTLCVLCEQRRIEPPGSIWRVLC